MNRELGRRCRYCGGPVKIGLSTACGCRSYAASSTASTDLKETTRIDPTYPTGRLCLGRTRRDGRVVPEGANPDPELHHGPDKITYHDDP